MIPSLLTKRVSSQNSNCLTVTGFPGPIVSLRPTGTRPTVFLSCGGWSHPPTKGCRSSRFWPPLLGVPFRIRRPLVPWVGEALQELRDLALRPRVEVIPLVGRRVAWPAMVEVLRCKAKERQWVKTIGVAGVDAFGSSFLSCYFFCSFCLSRSAHQSLARIVPKRGMISSPINRRLVILSL